LGGFAPRFGEMQMGVQNLVANAQGSTVINKTEDSIFISTNDRLLSTTMNHIHVLNSWLLSRQQEYIRQ